MWIVTTIGYNETERTDECRKNKEKTDIHKKIKGLINKE